MNETQVVGALGALAHPLRLKVFRALVVNGSAGLTPGVIQEAVEIPASTLSFHLKELVNAGLVSVERASRSLIYRADYERMSGVLAFLTANCCGGEPCAVEAAPAACDC
jgi:ArsR family transcriptional regulator, arsenate/arsenite/antimonite-responsive transcriptional repressor